MEEPFNQEKERESVRRKIALRLVATLVGVVIVIILIGVATATVCARKGECHTDIAEMKSIRAMTQLILTPLVGLVGAVTGFYFGEKSAAAKPA